MGLLEGCVWRLDVELTSPGRPEATEGRTVRPLRESHDLSSDRYEAGQFLSTVNTKGWPSTKVTVCKPKLISVTKFNRIKELKQTNKLNSIITPIVYQKI